MSAGRGQIECPEEPKGHKSPVRISCGPPVHSKGVGGTWPRKTTKPSEQYHGHKKNTAAIRMMPLPS